MQQVLGHLGGAGKLDGGRSSVLGCVLRVVVVILGDLSRLHRVLGGGRGVCIANSVLVAARRALPPHVDLILG